jgi:hypothetical protein
MAEAFTIEKGKRGLMLVARSAWSDAMASAVRERGLLELELNYAKGFVGKDLSFLKDLTGLQVLLLTHRTIEDVSPVQHLRELRVLELNTYCKTAIDFTRFPALEECALEWRAGAASLFSAAALTKLFVNGYTGQRADKFARLSALRSLALANSALRALDGLGELPRLNFLGLYNLKKLKSLDGVERLTSLEHLEVNGCRNVESLDPLASLSNLRRLHFCDDGHIQSLRPLSGLKNLEEVLFYESTHILDGDLSPLAGLPKLRKVWFEDRNHYSEGRGELQALVGMGADGAG